MITRMSQLFFRTLREDPADAEVPSHRWLVRAGYIRRAAPGIYSWLPLGLRVLANVEQVVREEMDAIGAQEVRFPALLPREPYEATNRWTEYGPNLFRLKDRKGGDYLLGPTHEEMFTLVVKDLYSSYKDLPLALYQIQTKYRDEARPRAGLLRGREFVMKDSYSFDVDDAGLDASYEAHRQAYIRIFDRLGFEYVVFKLTTPDGTTDLLVVGLPGDRDVDLKRLDAAVAPAEATPVTDDDFAANPGLVKGYIGPVRVTDAGPVQYLGVDGEAKIRYLLDPRVVSGTSWITGANVVDTHQVDVVAGRDFAGDGVLDVAEIREGDPAPDGSGPLTLARGIEMGHIFQLGRKYAEALGLKVLDENGKLVTVTMGSYGIGVSRAVAAVAEGTCDERGLAWPRELAPFDIQVLATGKGVEIEEAAVQLAEDLDAAGLKVLLDDRKASPGVKFTDAEVMGMPTSVVVGRGLADGLVEVRDRASGEREEVPLADAVAHLLAVVHNR